MIFDIEEYHDKETFSFRVRESLEGHVALSFAFDEWQDDGRLVWFYHNGRYKAAFNPALFGSSVTEVSDTLTKFGVAVRADND
ncbi:hypothetical protein M2H12_14990 [Vibrio vulnificus]|nr:hypothetical protein [Vibrio vulnificus]MCU8167006.1 hypothetical protein [Vibrio vulnificus]MCU8171445.1 hypothetical protein [Vibrio vulnificus]MCU8266217.1 hypothetical protein [Vibrio vulnificus]